MKTKITKLLQFSVIIMIGMSMQSASAQWRQENSGFTAQHGIIDMSAPDEQNCYAIGYDATDFSNYIHQITITHDGGKTWHAQIIHELKNCWLEGLAAPVPNEVHVIAWNYVDGGGKALRSADGGTTWESEADNAYTDAAVSFPDDIGFFDKDNGVIFGDPENGSFEIYTTSDGGHKWRRVPASDIPAPHVNEYGATFLSDVSGNTIWSVTITVDSLYNPVSARLLQSDDKGKKWYERCPSLPFNGDDGVIRFRNHSVGLYKNNGNLYRTTDGGTTWNIVNYEGNYFSFCFDNMPGVPGCWVSTGGDANIPANSFYGIGSSITFDDGDHWALLDTGINHTFVLMTGPFEGYSGGITSGSGIDGVFVFALLKHHDDKRFANESENESAILTAYPNPSGSVFNLRVAMANDVSCFMRVYSMKGQLVMEQTFNSSQEIRFGEGLAPGLYQAEVVMGNERQSFRLMKQ